MPTYSMTARIPPAGKTIGSHVQNEHRHEIQNEHTHGTDEPRPNIRLDDVIRHDVRRSVDFLLFRSLAVECPHDADSRKAAPDQRVLLIHVFVGNFPKRMNTPRNQKNHRQNDGHERKQNERQHPIFTKGERRAQNHGERNGGKSAQKSVDDVPHPIHVFDGTGNQRARSHLFECICGHGIHLRENFRAKVAAKAGRRTLSDFICKYD